MDRLDELVGAAAPLLGRVDDVLTEAGAPAEHGVWDQLRRVRLLPGDAVKVVAGLRPDDFPAATAELRADARACVETAAGLPGPGDWEGEAAEAYDRVRERVAGQLSGGGESLDERLEATADLAQALGDWMATTRSDLAAALARVLASGEAVVLGAGIATPPAANEIDAAAEVAAYLLRIIADDYAEAADLLQGSADLAASIPM